MKLSITYVLISIATICSGQIDSLDFYKCVIGFVPKGTIRYTVFYDKPNGTKVDSLNAPKSGWIQFVILKQEGNWVQIKEATIAPGIQDLMDLKETWIIASNVWFNLSNDSSNCYQNPSLDSEYYVVEFHTVNLIEIIGSWAKAKFEVDGVIHVGWFRKEDQCGMPWTTCNY